MLASKKRRRRTTSYKRDALVLENMPLVKHVLNRVAHHLPPHVDRDDLLEAGVVGLVEAAERFDPRRSVHFRSYAMPRIHGAIMDALRMEDWLPRSMRDEIGRLGEVESRLEQEHGRPPTAEELSRALGMNVKKVRKLARYSSTSTFRSLDDGVEEFLPDEAGAGRPHTASHPAEMIETEEQRQQVSTAVSALPSRERQVIEMYYFERLRVREIAKRLGITDSRVSQIHKAALRRLKRELDDDTLLPQAAVTASKK